MYVATYLTLPATYVRMYTYVVHIHTYINYSVCYTAYMYVCMQLIQSDNYICRFVASSVHVESISR